MSDAQLTLFPRHDPPSGGALSQNIAIVPIQANSRILSFLLRTLLSRNVLRENPLDIHGRLSYSHKEVENSHRLTIIIRGNADGL
jgi:hypothetical protein